MNKDDTIYIILLLISTPLGFIFRHFRFTPKEKAIVSSCIGFVMILIVCTYDVLHSLILSLVNSLLLLIINPKYVPYFSFVWCFGYLLFFRLNNLFDLPKPVAYANAVQLILTLKSVGLAFEVHDSYKRKKDLFKLNEEIKKSLLIVGDDNAKNEAEISIASQSEKNDKAKIDKLKLEMEFFSLDPKPKFIESMLYSYCYIGILTGPYFRYRTYKDWLNFKYTENIDYIDYISKRGKAAPFIIIGFLVLSKFVSFKDAALDEFYDNPLWYRLIYMPIIFTLFRFRFYIAWIFAEFSCYTAAFGAYPKLSKPKPGAGPTDLIEFKKIDVKSLKSSEYSFDAINNINEIKCETALTVKEVLHYWNMTVQYWMASFVYKRVPLKKLGQPITMAVSAYWHGLHPGYYLSMLTTSPCILAENLMDKGFKRRFLSEKYFKYYNFCTWFFRTRLFDYMSLGFILLSYDATIRFWKSVYFIGHLSCAFFIILGFSLLKFAKNKRKPNDTQEKDK